MTEGIERVLEMYDARRIDRRQAVVALAAAAGALAGIGSPASAADADEKATFSARGLNHIALRVPDVARSASFYERHLGLETIRRNGDANRFLSCGDHFVALFRGEPARLDHFCFTIDGYDAGAVQGRLEAAGLNPARQENRVYFSDPDGIRLQLSGARDAWPGR